MKRVVLAAMLVAAAGMFAFDAPAQAAGGHVDAKSNTFNDGTGCSTSPGETTTIVVNEMVTWHNCDAVAHTITSDDGGSTFDQPLPAPTDPSYHDVAINFHTPGSYPYHCKIHGTSMKGTIVVTDSGTSSTSTTSTTVAPPASSSTTKATTTTSTTVAGATTTSVDLNGVFDGSTSSSGPTTTIFSTGTTRALGEGGDEGTSAGVIAALIVGLGAVGTAAALIIRRMRGATPPGV